MISYQVNSCREHSPFFSLLRAGLWEQSVLLLPFEPIDYDALYKQADEQSVVGLIAAGLENVVDKKVTKQQALPFLKKVFSIEKRNAEMNQFIESLVGRMRQEGIITLLVKGQGVARCYERPLWRSAGDIDLLMDEPNYQKAKDFLIPLASDIDAEYEDRKHLAMTINSWTVELHGSLRSKRLGRVNKCIDAVQYDTFHNGNVRVWRIRDTDVFLPAVDNDIIFIFTHILQHFFSGGIGLRQICDWCRLIWTYRDIIDRELLMSRLVSIHLQSEWEVFASLAVNYLGMPAAAMPLFRESSTLIRKADHLMSQILRTGNFGQNRDMSYIQESPLLVRKIISMGRATRDALFRMRIFPVDSVSFFINYVVSSLESSNKL